MVNTSDKHISVVHYGGALRPLQERRMKGGTLEFCVPYQRDWLLSTLSLAALIVFLAAPSFHWSSVSISTLLFAASALYVVSTHVVEEQVLVIPCVGLQLTTKRGIRFGDRHVVVLRTSTTFIPRDVILDIFANESIFRWYIVDYVVVAVRQGSEKNERQSARTNGIHVLFPTTMPNLAIVRHVYKAIYPVIFADAAKVERIVA